MGAAASGVMGVGVGESRFFLIRNFWKEVREESLRLMEAGES